MEISCPSCGAKHRTEDYLGSFEIQCACGYSILVPDEDNLSAEDSTHAEDGPPPSFDDAPMALQERDDAAKISLVSDEDESLSQEALEAHLQDDNSSFSALDLTSPEDLPDGMPYDPFELQTRWGESDDKVEKTPESKNSIEDKNKDSDEAKEKPPQPPQNLTAQDIVDRIQLASIGHLHGPLFNVAIGHLDEEKKVSLKNHIEKFLSEHIYLREYLPEELNNPSKPIRTDSIERIPEPLAVEIYIFCAESNQSCTITPNRE